MDFIKKTELFFIQLQYCLAIEPEPVLEGERGLYNIMLEPDVFFKLIKDFNIDYPFISENKIIELKCAMINENIDTKDALTIIKNYKKQYWLLDAVVMFAPVTDKLKQVFKSIDSEISEQEINLEVINYQIHLQTKREKIYSDLINELNLKLVEKITNPITTPKYENIFCNNGFELFDHILKEYIKPINTKGRQSDLIFYHRKLYDNKPQYIHKRPTEFFKWFENNYAEVVGQLQTLSQVETPQRNKDFSNALDWFKRQPQQVP
jgi:hypothetical protein